jgi:hypothetical protein
VALHPPADVDQRPGAAARGTRPPALLGYLPPNGAAAALVGHVLDLFRVHVLADDLAVTLLTRKSSGVTSPPTTASPRPQLALIATMLGSPLTGLQVNITPETSASTICWTATPIAGTPVAARSLARYMIAEGL